MAKKSLNKPGTIIGLNQTKVPIKQIEIANAVAKSDAELSAEAEKMVSENFLVEKKEKHEDTVQPVVNERRSDYDSADPEDDRFNRGGAREFYSYGYRGGDFAYTPGSNDASEDTLEEHLMKQLNELAIDKHQLLIAQNIIGNLDNNGWLTRTCRAIADDITFKEEVETSTHDVEEVLTMVQKELDPPGVAARTLRECILLQLERMNQTDSVKLAYKVIDEYIKDLGQGHYKEICAALNITMQQLKDAEKMVHKTHPRPGSGFSSGIGNGGAPQITPEFEIDVNGDKITCTLPNRIPDLVISEEFSENAELLKSDKTFEKRYNEATKFIELLKVRQMKLFAVMNSIIKHQKDFFLSGNEEDLRPLKYKDIEKDTDFDTSTISRVCSNKYAFTPYGTYRLKDFFTGSGGADDDKSAAATKAALKGVVDGEDKSKPLSDDAIMKALAAKGYMISRRTVAKYREQLDIADSRMRKQLIVK